MKTDLFDYDLPRELIAQHPAAERDRSRLLVLNRGTGAIEHRVFADLPQFLRPNDLLVVNDTRVIRARLYGTRRTGGVVEILLIRPAKAGGNSHTHPSLSLGGRGITSCADSPSPCQGNTGRNAQEKRKRGLAPAERAKRPPDEGPAKSGAETCLSPFLWEAMINCRGQLRDGEEVRFSEDLSARLAGRNAEGVSLVEIRCDGELGAVLDRIGRAPLPPYIKRPKTDDPDAAEDAERYQTVYAREPGAVAAPTAGLHFTPELIERIRAAGCGVAAVTLHVGPGTFKPVTADEVEDHRVDAEYYRLSGETAEAAKRARRIVAVGTTTCRVLETAGREGKGSLAAGEDWTSLVIYPPFDFNVVGALVTNFHLPRSSLLMLVSAFAGRERILAAYEEAVRERYRFYSYGDAMLIM